MNMIDNIRYAFDIAIEKLIKKLARRVDLYYLISDRLPLRSHGATTYFRLSESEECIYAFKEADAKWLAELLTCSTCDNYGTIADYDEEAKAWYIAMY